MDGRARQESESAWRPMALVLHTETNGIPHFDWFLARVKRCDDSDARLLRAFRCGSRLDQTIPAEGVSLDAIADHRWHYLQLNAPCELSRGRGIVAPVARGFWQSAADATNSTVELIDIRWEHTTARRMGITAKPDCRLLALDTTG